MDVKIIDIHTHIIYDVDDGSKSYSESMEMMRLASKVGIVSMVATSHYLKPRYVIDIEELNEKFNKLKEGIKKENITLDIYLGNEVMISESMIDDLSEGLCNTIHQTRYLLFECPFYGEITTLKEIIFEMRLHGYIPIFAHPERYEFIQKDIDFLEELINMGVLLQMSLPSLGGYYGKAVKRTARKMVKKGFIHFLGTDMHRMGSRVLDIDPAIKYLRRNLSSEAFQNVTYMNAERMLNDIEI